MAIWIITRWIKEEAWVEAETRKEAMELASDYTNPGQVTVTKETCVKEAS
jgi:hypothetical protein